MNLIQSLQEKHWFRDRLFDCTSGGGAPKGNCSFLDQESREEDFPGGTVVKNLPASAGDTGSSPGPGRSHMPRSN